MAKSIKVKEKLYTLAVMARLGTQEVIDDLASFPYQGGQKFITSKEDREMECLWYWVDLGQQKSLTDAQRKYLSSNNAIITSTILPVDNKG